MPDRFPAARLALVAAGLATLALLTACGLPRPDKFELAEASTDFRDHVDGGSSVAVLGVCVATSISDAVMEDVAPADAELFDAVRKHWSSRRIEAPHQLDFAIGREVRVRILAEFARHGYLTRLDLDSLRVHGCDTDLIIVARVEDDETQLEALHTSNQYNDVPVADEALGVNSNPHEEVVRPEPTRKFSEDGTHGFYPGGRLERRISVAMHIYDLRSGQRLWKGSCLRSGRVRMEYDDDRVLAADAVVARIEDPDKPPPSLLTQPDVLPILADALDELNGRAVRTYRPKGVDGPDQEGLDGLM